MAILITGAAGFIGSHVVDRLLERGENVVGLDLFDTFYDPAIKSANLASAQQHERFRLIRGDIRDRGVLANLPNEIELVVHLAARAGVRPSIREPALYNSVNVDGTLALLEWARERQIRPFIFASSSSVYGNQEKVPFSEEDPAARPISPYAATKMAGEMMCHTWHHLYGLQVLCLRLFTVYGPRQRPDLAIHKFARLMTEGRPIPLYGDGSTQRDYTYIQDLVDGMMGGVDYLRATGGTFEVVNLGESRTIPLKQMIQVLGEEMGHEPKIDRLPLQPGDVLRTYADIRKAIRLLRYDPTTDFREGIRRFVRWFREHPRPS